MRVGVHGSISIRTRCVRNNRVSVSALLQEPQCPLSNDSSIIGYNFFKKINALPITQFTGKETNKHLLVKMCGFVPRSSCARE